MIKIILDVETKDQHKELTVTLDTRHKSVRDTPLSNHLHNLVNEYMKKWNKYKKEKTNGTR